MIITKPTASVRAGHVEIRPDGLTNVHLPDGTIIYGLLMGNVEECLDWLDAQREEQRRERARQN